MNDGIAETPAICKRCGKRETLFDGDPYSCSLMVEAKNAGVGVMSCAHFKAVV